jgi:hypothetical protein
VRGKPWRAWTAHELAQVDALLDQGLTPTQIAKNHFPDRTMQAVIDRCTRSIRDRRRQVTPLHAGELSRLVPASAHGAKDASPEQSDDEFLAQWFTETDRACRFYSEGNIAEYTVTHRRPVKVSFSSDWHLSASGATYARDLSAYLDALAATPDAIGIAVGDLIDLSIRHGPTDMRGAPTELRALRILLSKVQDRLIVLSGNHDERTTQLTGISALAETCRELGIPFFRDEVCLFVTHRDDDGEVVSRRMVAARHAYHRDSTLNWTHKLWRWYESADWPEAPGDESGAIMKPSALAIGHSHQGSSETRRYGTKPVHGLALGPWQAGSRYAAFKGFTSSGPTAPTVILPPTPRQPTTLIEDWREALGGIPVEVPTPAKKKRRSA